MFVSPVNSTDYLISQKTKKSNNADSSSRKVTVLQKTLAFKQNGIIKKSTSAANPFRRLKNITDAYFGKKLITSEALSDEEKILLNKSTVEPAVRSLRKFKSNMQKVERNIYEGFASIMNDIHDMDFADVLKMWYSQALVKLKLEEFDVLNTIDKMSQDLTPNTRFEIIGKTTRCRQIILDNNPDNPFKRKTLLDSLNEITPKDREAVALAELRKQAEKLPTSNTSENAFIVKYSKRGHYEIATRLIEASRLVVDHIHSSYKGGKDDIGNLTLTSASANGLKGCMPLSEFCYLYPHIVSNPQLYMNDIIYCIHNRILRGFETYPYTVSKTFYDESNGLIKIDLSGYHISPTEAEKMEEKAKRKYKKQK